MPRFALVVLFSALPVMAQTPPQTDASLSDDARLLAGLREYPDAVIKALIRVSGTDVPAQIAKSPERLEQPEKLENVTADQRSAVLTLRNVPDALFIAIERPDLLERVAGLYRADPGAAERQILRLRGNYRNLQLKGAIAWQTLLAEDPAARAAYEALVSEFVRENVKAFPEFPFVEVTDSRYYLAAPPDEMLIGWFASKEGRPAAATKLLESWWSAHAPEIRDQQATTNSQLLYPVLDAELIAGWDTDRRKGMWQPGKADRVTASSRLMPVLMQPPTDQPVDARFARAAIEQDRLWSLSTDPAFPPDGEASVAAAGPAPVVEGVDEPLVAVDPAPMPNDVPPPVVIPPADDLVVRPEPIEDVIVRTGVYGDQGVAQRVVDQQFVDNRPIYIEELEIDYDNDDRIFAGPAVNWAPWYPVGIGYYDYFGPGCFSVFDYGVLYPRRSFLHRFGYTNVNIGLAFGNSYFHSGFRRFLPNRYRRSYYYGGFGGGFGRGFYGSPYVRGIRGGYGYGYDYGRYVPEIRGRGPVLRGRGVRSSRLSGVRRAGAVSGVRGTRSSPAGTVGRGTRRGGAVSGVRSGTVGRSGVRGVRSGTRGGTRDAVRRSGAPTRSGVSGIRSGSSGRSSRSGIRSGSGGRSSRSGIRSGSSGRSSRSGIRSGSSGRSSRSGIRSGSSGRSSRSGIRSGSSGRSSRSGIRSGSSGRSSRSGIRSGSSGRSSRSGIRSGSSGRSSRSGIRSGSSGRSSRSGIRSGSSGRSSRSGIRSGSSGRSSRSGIRSGSRGRSSRSGIRSSSGGRSSRSGIRSGSGGRSSRSGFRSGGGRSSRSSMRSGGGGRSSRSGIRSRGGSRSGSRGIRGTRRR